MPKSLPRGVLSSSEARKILRQADTKSVIGYRDRAILELLYSTGIRKEELGRIACRYLENYIQSVRPDLIKDPLQKHLFLTLRGKPLSKNTLWELVKKYARKAKIQKNVHPHTFRHTCATAMLKNKANIRAVQELLGHSSLNSTQVYTHLTITDLKAIHARCHPREKEKE